MRRLPHLTISPLFLLLCLLCVRLGSSALSINCEGEGGPLTFFVPLTAKFEIKCGYQLGADPIQAYRFDESQGTAIAMYKVRKNETRNGFRFDALWVPF